MIRPTRCLQLLAFAVSAIILSCTESPVSPGITGITIGKSVLIATTTAINYAEGNLGILYKDNNSTKQNLLEIYGDNFVRTSDGSIYILERWGRDNVIKIGVNADSSCSILYQKNLGQNINIQDIAFAGNSKAYVTSLNSRYVYILSTATGSITDSIDLSAYNAYAGTDSAAPVPYASGAIVCGTNLYVACQRLKPNEFYQVPADTSMIVIISTNNDSPTGAIKLAFKNPYSIDTVGGKLFVAGTGEWSDLSDGGIERINLSSGINEGIVVTEAALNGDVSDLAFTDATHGFVSVQRGTYPDNYNALLPFNPTTGTVGTVISGVDNAFGGLATAGDTVFVGDRSKTAPGIVLINGVTNGKIAGPFSVGMPPNALAFLHVD